MKSFLVGTPVVWLSLNEDIDMSACRGKQAGECGSVLSCD